MAGEVKRQMGVALPDDLREQLQLAADAAGHSVAAEIRKRVEESFRSDGINQPTRELANDVIELAQLVRLDVGANWNTDPGAHAAFKSAVGALIDEHKPEGAPVFGAVRDLFGAGISKSDDPDTLGRALVRHYRRSKPNPQAAQRSAARFANWPGTP